MVVSGDLGIRLTSLDDVVALADWFEGSLVAGERTRLSRSRIREGIQSRWSMEDRDELDVTVELLFQEFGRRARIARESYPFIEDSTGFRRRGSAGLAYDFLLVVCVSGPLRDEGRQQEVERLVDELALDALRGYLGERACGIRFGWPASGGRPTAFGQAVQWLCDHMGLQPGVGRVRPKSNDGGLDVVVWNPFRDKRTGFVSVHDCRRLVPQGQRLD
jgi:hypothetical protein